MAFKLILDYFLGEFVFKFLPQLSSEEQCVLLIPRSCVTVIKNDGLFNQEQ